MRRSLDDTTAKLCTRRGRFHGARRRDASRKIMFDALEGRALMSSAPPAQPIALPALQTETVDNNFGPGSSMEVWKVQLQKGDYLGIDLSTPGVGQAGQMTVLNPFNKVVARSVASSSPTMVVGASSTGTYYIEVKDKTPQAGPAVDKLAVQRFALNSGAPLPTSSTDQRWSWISGKTLYIANSNGTGYGINANWKKTVATDPATGLPMETYTAVGKMTIDVQVPVVTKTTPGKAGAPASTRATKTKVDTITINGSMTVETTSSPEFGGDAVGTIDSTNLQSSPSKGSGGVVKSQSNGVAAVQANSTTGATFHATQLLNSFSQMYGVTINQPGLNFGMAAGSQLGFLGAPLQPNETYFYAQLNAGASASFGGISASASGGHTFTLIVDPADPFVYVQVDTVTFGGSVKGMIPFVPAAPSYAGPTFNGNLYGSVTGVQLGELPVSVGGNVTISLDPNRTGHPLGINGNASTLFTTAGISSALSNIAIGANGTASLGYDVGGVGLSIPVGAASVGFVPGGGTFQEYKLRPGVPALPFILPPSYPLTTPPPSSLAPLYQIVTLLTPAAFGVAGGTVNPLAGTPVASLFAGNGFSVSAHSTGSSVANLLDNLTVHANEMTGGLNLLGYQLGEAQNVGLTINHESVNLDASIPIFIGQVDLTGTVALSSPLSFDLNGTLDPSDFPASSFLNDISGSVSLADNYPGVNNGLIATVNLGFNHSHTVKVLGTFGVRGNVSGSITIDPSNSNYGGNLRATGGTISFSDYVSASFGVSLSGNTITVTTPLDAYDFSFQI